MLDHLKCGPNLSAELNAITPSRMEDFPSVGITPPNEEWLFNKQDRMHRISKYSRGDFFCTGNLSKGLESAAHSKITKRNVLGIRLIDNHREKSCSPENS